MSNTLRLVVLFPLLTVAGCAAENQTVEDEPTPAESPIFEPPAEELRPDPEPDTASPTPSPESPPAASAPVDTLQLRDSVRTGPIFELPPEAEVDSTD